MKKAISTGTHFSTIVHQVATSFLDFDEAAGLLLDLRNIEQRPYLICSWQNAAFSAEIQCKLTDILYQFLCIHYAGEGWEHRYAEIEEFVFHQTDLFLDGFRRFRVRADHTRQTSNSGRKYYDKK